MEGNQKIEMLERRFEREKLARKEAERILEEKALELYQANSDLHKLNESLEVQIKKRTADLNSSRVRYKKLVESANEIVFEVDRNFKLIYVNPAAYHLLLFSEEELSKITFLELVAPSHKDKVRNYIIDCLKQKITQGYLEFPVQKKNGEIIWLGQNFQLDFIEKEGELLFNGIKAMARNITDIYYAQLKLRLSEEKYRLIMENMELGFMEVDLSGTIVRVYDRFCKMTGYEEHELLGKKADDVFLPDEYKELLKEQDQNRLKGETGSYELNMITKDGSRLWVIVSGGPVFDEKGEVVGSIGIHYDISDQKKVQAELAEAKEQAEASQRAEQEFLANMSHEIRTPLNAVIGMSHLLYDTNPNEEQTEYLDIIKNSANFLHALISDVLDMAKIEAGKVEIKNSEFDILSILRTLHRTYELKTKSKGVDVILDVDPNLNTFVIGDELILNQVLNNLLSNAEKFTDHGSIVLSVKIGEKIGEDKYILKFAVKDSGQGMDDEKAKLVFQKFKQIYEKNATKTKGTGLGLAIVKELIELQGGRIYLETAINKGSTFFFDLPFEITNKTAAIQNETVFSDNVLEFKEKNILIAEDNPMNFKYLNTLLNKWHINYQHAPDGRDALELIKSHTFDLVLMDIQMPYLDGYGATLSIRATPGPNQHIPIVALTASAMVMEKDKAIEAGMEDILTKPFTPDQLKRVLNKYLTSNPINNIKIEEIPMQTSYIDDKINQQSLVDYFGDDKDFMKIVFETFLEEITSQVEEFKQFFAEENWEEIAKLGHKMKPSFAMVGLGNTEELLKSIESEIKTSGISEDIKTRIQLFINTFPSLVSLVQTENDNIK